MNFLIHAIQTLYTQASADSIFRIMFIYPVEIGLGHIYEDRVMKMGNGLILKWIGMQETQTYMSL